MKVGFIAVVGRPNVGKSSLLNKIVDYKLSITSSTPQTTHNQIKVIYNDKESQIIFLDTPGIHKPQQKLGEFLNNAATKSIKDADFVIFLSPINEKIGDGDNFIINKLDKNKTAIVITKIDLGNIKDMKHKVNDFQKLGFNNILSTTIKKQVSIVNLIKFLKQNLPQGNPYFYNQEISDVSMRFIASEIIRETAIEKTREEIPHVIRVSIEEFNENDKFIKIVANIFVEKKSQKGILIGKHASMIKEIGTIARRKIRKIMNNTIILNIKIKVDKNWTNDKNKLIKNGY